MVGAVLMRVEFGRAPAPSTPRRRSLFRPRRRRFRAGNRCGGASPRVMNAARSCFRKTAARVRNDSLLRHAVVETPGMQQRPAARSLRRDGARRPAVPRWAPFSELSRKIKVSENGIDRRRCGAAKPRPRRAKPRRRRGALPQHRTSQWRATRLAQADF